ncbi:MAG: TldD/PmbA family protein [Theionarchaea archaeon]|nr:TldD/PmbA family protein [Theionarchaea archaeon]
MTIYGKDDVLTILEKALKYSEADQCEAYISGISWGLTRFANNYIHQHVSEDNALLTVRTVFGKKVGKAKTNQLDSASIKEVVRRAEGITRAQPENKDFGSLPSPTPLKEVRGFHPGTAALTPSDRAEAIREAIHRSEEKGMERVSGTYYTGIEEMAVMNSLGIEAYFKGTLASFKINTVLEEGTGLGQHSSRDHEALDIERITDRACEKALLSRKTESIPAGSYPVILEEAACCEMFGYLASMAFSAQSYQEGRSAFSGRLGEKMAHEKVTIWDDGLEERGFPMPFDVEGVGKHRLDIMENGVARAVAYDSYHAHREGKKSTGHAIEAPNSIASIPLNLFVKKGDQSLQDMISSCEKGILVTRFHYTNPMHPLKTIITGMTRDGTFWIENGEITRGLKNFRFTQGILDALQGVEAVSDQWGIQRMEYLKASICAPALHLKKFTFTGTTLF